MGSCEADKVGGVGLVSPITCSKPAGGGEEGGAKAGEGGRAPELLGSFWARSCFLAEVCIRSIGLWPPQRYVMLLLGEEVFPLAEGRAPVAFAPVKLPRARNNFRGRSCLVRTDSVVSS